MPRTEGPRHAARWSVVVGCVALFLFASARTGATAGSHHHAPFVPTLFPRTGASPVPPSLGTRWSALPPAPVPAGHLGSTATNWYMGNWSGEGSIAENPADPSNLVAGGLYQAPSAANNSSVYQNDGVSGAFTTWDGGRTWTPHVLPTSPLFSNTSSVQCGHIHLADTSIVFGPNSTVYYIDLSYPIGGGGCLGAGGNGLFVTISGDGGNTWQTPVCIAGTTTGGSIDEPWAAIDPVTGEVYVAYTDDGNGSGIYVRNSTDGGQHWSKAVAVSQGSGSMRGVEIAVDAYGGVDAEWLDQSKAAIHFARSTDHGHTFSTPVQVAMAKTSYPSSSPDSFRDYTLPSITVDPYRTNPFTDTILVAWHDGTGGSAGSPHSVEVRSTDNGSTWSSAISMASNSGVEDFQPSEAFGPDGTVYAVWYSENPSNGHLRLDGSLSHDGGQSWDPEVRVSDVDAIPSAPPSGLEWWIGDYTDIVADAKGAHPVWTDARSQMAWSCAVACLWGYVYNISLFSAELVNGSLGSSVPVTGWANGTLESAGSVSLGPAPSPADWRVGDRYELTVPNSTTYNGSTWFFGYWYGRSSNGSILFSSSPRVNGTVDGPFFWRACFTLVPGTTCSLPGAPGFLGYRVVPSWSRVWIDGTLTGAASSPARPVWPGSHWFNASAPGYFPLQLPLGISPGMVAWENLSLRPELGTIAGSVSPASASVTVNGTAVPVLAAGTFSVQLPQGSYLLRATAVDYGPAATNVNVSAGNTTLIRVVLADLPGWINGTVVPASASLTLNGRALPVAADGSFSASVLPGTYWVNGTAAGFLPGSTGPIVVGPFGTASPQLLLVRAQGTLAGVVSPASARVLVNGSLVATTLGSFRVELPAGSYSLTASASTYEPFVGSLSIRPGTTTVVTLALNLSGGWIVGTVAPAGASVALDGAALGLSAGAFNASVPAGSHSLLVQAPGYVGQNLSIVVFPGRASSVAVTLAHPSATSAGTVSLSAIGPWLLLAGAAAVALGGYVVWRRRKANRERR